MEQNADEWALWLIDQEINRRGVPLDLDFVRAADAMVRRHLAAVHARILQVTGGIEPGTTNAFRSFMRDHGGSGELNEQARTAELESGQLDEAGAVALRGFDEISSAAVRKYATMLDMAQDGRLRHQFSFCGADQTGRWSSKGVQIQNLPRPTLRTDSLWLARDLILAGDYDNLARFGIEPLDGLLSCVRTAIAAPPGSVLHVGDLSTIEPRTQAWSTGCTRLQQVFATGRDPYRDFASTLFSCNYDDMAKSDPRRQDAKPGFLGCGYGLGAATLVAQSKAQGRAITLELALKSVQAFAVAYPEVLQAWADHEEAARAALQRPGTIWRVGPAHMPKFKPYAWFMEGRFLRCRLPSGRLLSFLDPRLGRNEDSESWKFGKLEMTCQGSKGRTALYGSKLFATLNQATARDVLAAGMRNCQAAGLGIVMHVHDELVIEDGSADQLEACMTAEVPWMPDVALKAEVMSGQIYAKV